MEGTFNDLMFNLALAFLTLLASYAMYYIKKATSKLAAETDKIKDEEQRQLIQMAVSRLDDVAEKTVMKIEQTTAKELREAVKSGKAGKEELFKLADRAFLEIVKTMEPEYVAALKSTLGDLDAYIASTIEAKVLELKEAAK